MAEPTRRTTRRRQVASTHAVQAAVEGVDLSLVVGDVTGDQPREACPRCGEAGCVCLRVEFMGESYLISDRIGLMPLLKFAHAAASGLDSDTMQGMAAQYAMIRDCIDPQDWPRFEYDAIDKKAGPGELDKVTADVIEMLTARPTQPPSDSSAGRPETLANSKGSSPSPGTPPPPALTSAGSRGR